MKDCGDVWVRAALLFPTVQGCGRADMQDVFHWTLSLTLFPLQ